MTVTANTTRNDYTAGSAQSEYDYTFQLNEAADVDVYLDGVKQTLNTHYVVQNVGNASGGTIVFTLEDENGDPIDPTEGAVINIVMAMDLDRDTNYQPSGAFLAADVNNDFDRLWLATNQQQTAVNRALRLKDTDVTTSSMELPLKDDRKGKLLAFNAITGDPETTSNSQSNWDTAYDNMITSAAFVGSTLLLGQQDGGVVSATHTPYLPITGGTLTGDLNVGSNDFTVGKLTIDGVVGDNTRIREFGGGDLLLQATNLKFLNADGTEKYVECIANGAVSLYHDNVEKLTTTSSGIDITGDLNVGFNDFTVGRLTITGTIGDNTSISETGGGDLLLQATNLQLMNANGTEKYIKCTADGDVKLYHDNDEKLTTTATGINIVGDLDVGSNDFTVRGLTISGGVGDYTSITESGSGDLLIQGTNLKLLNADGTEKFVECTADGDVKLFYDNAEKLATTSTGIDVTGDFTVGKLTIDGVIGDNTRITESGGGDLLIQATNLKLLSADGTEKYLECTADGDAKLYYDNAEKLATTATGINVTGDSSPAVRISNTRNDSNWDTDPVFGALEFYSSDTSGSGASVRSKIQAEAFSEYGNATDLVFYSGDTLGVATERMRLNYAGRLGIGTTSPVRALDVRGGTTDVVANFESSDTGGYISLQDNTTSSDTAVLVGAIGDALRIDTGDTESLRIDSSGNVGIGTTNPTSQLTVTGTGGANSGFAVRNTNEVVKGYFGSDAADADFLLTYANSGSAEVKLKHNGNVILCESAGNVGINKSGANTALDVNGTVTATDYAGDGSALTGVLSDLIDDTTPQLGGTLDANDKEIQNVQNIGIGFSGDVNYNIQVEDIKAATNIEMMRIKNTGSYNGRVMTFYRGSNLHGNIGTSTILYGQGVYVSSGNGGLKFQNQFTTTVVEPCGVDGADYDNAVDLGRSSNRFDDIYATNSTIQTSDRNLKQDIESLTDAEQRVAVAAKGLLRKFRWRDAVEEKGDDARIHFGIIAQDLQDAFTAEGLDSSKYAMFCSNTWWEHEGENYYEADHAPEGATEVTRLGVRYSELLAFIISAI